jgi:isopenicillin-N N-acyltransferase-like protein
MVLSQDKRGYETAAIRLAALCLLLCAAAGDMKACTLWGEASQGAGGGTIISKNRDWEPDHIQVLKMHRNAKGYAYFGLYAEGGETPGLKDGVNEKGLTVVTASASSLPKEMRNEQAGPHRVLGLLLSDYASCDEVLAKRDTLFPQCRAEFLMISDRKKILVVETGLHGRYAIRIVENGPATHTNHYLEKSLDDFNVKTNSSSTARLERITDLLQAGPASCNTMAFAAMSRDQHDGPNNSLWRTGKGTRTLSSWIVETPPEGAPKLRVVLANPGEAETTNTFVLDRKFWSQGPQTERDLLGQ